MRAGPPSRPPALPWLGDGPHMRFIKGHAAGNRKVRPSGLADGRWAGLGLRRGDEGRKAGWGRSLRPQGAKQLWGAPCPQRPSAPCPALAPAWSDGTLCPLLPQRSGTVRREGFHEGRTGQKGQTVPL